MMEQVISGRFDVGTGYMFIFKKRRKILFYKTLIFEKEYCCRTLRINV